MIETKRANKSHVAGIVDVCSKAFRETYVDLYSKNYIEDAIAEFYNEKRVFEEVTNFSEYWSGYFIALDGDKVLGVIGGNLPTSGKSEVYVLYLDPRRKREGIGSLLLDELTRHQKENGASEQWVSVTKGNMMGIPFYEASGFVFQEEVDTFFSNGEGNYRSLRYRRDI